VTDLTFADPCLLFALSRESQAFRREFRPQQGFPGAPCRARFHGPSWLTVLVLHTGIGPARCEKAVRWLLGHPVLGNVPYRPQVILSAGFSGALREDLKVGDVVLATDVADLQGNQWPATWPGGLPPGEWRPPLHRGRLLSTDQLVATPAAKAALGRQTGAVAVDMETAVLARLCSRHPVPFGCVRVISDDVQTALAPELLSLGADGQVSPLRLLTTLVRKPGLTGAVWRLAKQTRRATDQLARALGELLTLTLPWADEL
jgi:nucleoside phosphorylase